MSNLTLEQRFMRFQFSGMGGILGSGKRIEIYETLELLYSNGVQLNDALGEMYMVESKDGSKPKEVNAVVLHHCMSSYSSGLSLAESLAPWIPDQEMQLIRAGEQSGNLSPTLKDAVKVITAKKTIVSSVLSGTAYPIVLMVMVVILLYQIANNMVPQFERILPSDQWTGAASALKVIADGVTNYGLYGVIALVIFMFALFWSLPNLSRARVRVFLDKIPPYSVYRMLHGSTFLLNVSVMLRSGIKTKDVLQMMQRTGSPWLRERIGAALIGIHEGHNLGVALERSGYQFPDERSVRFLRLLANQDGFETRLTNFADRWLERSVAGIKAATGVILAMGISIAGILILLILAGVMSIQTLAQQSLA